MKRLIVNADDFGLSKGINRGIIEAFKYGTLTSTTIMANMPAFEDAISLVKENQNLGVGIHLNILRGRPVLSPDTISTITDRNGYFIADIIVFIKKLLLKRASLEEIEKEFRTQIERVLSTGIKVTHLDSEKHLHCYPEVLKTVIKLAKEYKIAKIRYINEKILLPKGENRLEELFRTLRSIQYYKVQILNCLCFISKKGLDKNNVSCPDHSYGIMLAGRITKKNYQVFLESLDNGTYEFICHPGHIDNELITLSKWIGNFYINKHREEELEVLLDTDLPSKIRKLDIRLINYAEL